MTLYSRKRGLEGNRESHKEGIMNAVRDDMAMIEVAEEDIQL